MKKSLIAIAVAGLLAASSGAQAVAFARAFNDVTNLIITPTSSITLGGTVNNSDSKACLPNTTCVTNGGAGVTDAAPSQINFPTYISNTYTTNEGAPVSYIVADASIDSQQVLGADFTRARNFAEGKLLTNSTATASAGNSSATLITSTFVVAGPLATFNFQFDSDPLIRVLLSNNAIFPSQAEGILALNFNIVNNTGQVVFNWAPDGVLGPITGGTENADAFTLNTSLTALPGNFGPLVYDPANCPVGSTPTGCFNATTNNLAAGTYTLNLSMRETVNLQLTERVQVPEPGSVLLLGIGLAALFASVRKVGAARRVA